MHMDFGAAFPDARASMQRGAHHVTQDPLYAIKNAMKLADAGLRAMLQRLELPGAAVDHFIPSISSMQIAHRMQSVFARAGIRPEAWRTNFTQVGYIGSVAVPVMLDTLVREDRLRPGDIVCTAAEESSKWMFAGAAFRWNP
jgi:3-oxoacyl-[acyl-carrier-protein] synthase III